MPPHPTKIFPAPTQHDSATASRAASKTTPSPVWTAKDLAANPHTHADKPEKVRRMFASIARSYDFNNRVHSFGRDAAWRRFAVRFAGLRANDIVLDAACGTGELTREFARATPRPAQVIGLDFTREMLDLARAKAPVASSCATSPPRVTYEEGDATKLPYPDASFDVVSIAFGIRNVGDPMRALREFRRVLRPGGRLVVLEFATPRNPLIAAVNRAYCGWLMPRTATLISRDRSGAYRYLPKSVGSFVSRERMREMLSEADFTAIADQPLTFGVCVCTRGEVAQPPPAAAL